MKDQIVISTVKNPSDGNHNLSEVKEAISNGYFIEQMISDCQSCIVYVLEKDK